MKTYTHPFPERKPGAAHRTAELLQGVSYLFYDRGWVRAHPNWNFPRVLSPYWRVLHSRTGGARVDTPRQGFVLDASNLVLIPTDVETALSASGTVDMLFSHTVPAFPLALQVAVRFDRPIEIRLGECHKAVIAELIGRNERDGRTDADLLLHRALLDLCFGELLAPVLLRFPQEGFPDGRILTMLAFMEEHLEASLSNAQLAARIGLGREQMMRLFRRVTGRSVKAYLRELRIARASRELAAGGKSVKQIAAECGFANRYYFTRVFVERMGMGPAAYRERFRRVSMDAGGPC
ncbi:MAG: helix-turn-helix transcriptional regulator [Kiritimatiellae bacterium]|nr:helix-turn-helix transcriptional regulator [Kiritimatiellia bacterium]